MIEYYEWVQFGTHYALMFISVAEPEKGTIVVGPFKSSFEEWKIKAAFIPREYCSINSDWLVGRMGLNNQGDADPLVRMISTVLALKEPPSMVNSWRMDEFDQEKGLKSFGYALSIETSRHLAKRLGLPLVTATQQESR